MNPENLTRLAEWSALWGVPGLETRVRISWSGRMSRSLGRCMPSKGHIRLNRQLAAGSPELLTEVLCHEAAHAAAFELYGKLARPHGREWQDLMRRAGFPPRASIRLDGPGFEYLRAGSRRKIYLYRCPRCGASRMAATPAARWRCGNCWRAGKGGELEITRVQQEGGA